MAIIKKRSQQQGAGGRGFTLLIAVIFMAVVLAIGLALGSLGYKQSVLASSALESQYAFYAADAGLECALRADEQDLASDGDPGGVFAYRTYSVTTRDANAASCGGVSKNFITLCYDGTTYHNFNDSCDQEWVTSWEIPLALTNPNMQYNAVSNPETRCAVVTVYKSGTSPGTTYLFSQGYDVACKYVCDPQKNGSCNTTATRFASRGLSATYSN